MTEKDYMDKMKRLWGLVSAPTENSKIKQLRNFIKKHKLCVTTVGKNRNKKTILIDIKRELNKKMIPKDILSHTLSFLKLKQRTQLSMISKTFHQAVILTNRNDKEIKLSGHVLSLLGKYRTYVKHCEFSKFNLKP